MDFSDSRIRWYQRLRGAVPFGGGGGEALLRDVHFLADPCLLGRVPQTPGSAASRAYIIRRLMDIGVPAAGGDGGCDHPAAYEQEFLRGTNVIAKVTGTTHPDVCVVVSCHYDHLGVNSAGEVFTGADDNASGVAALLALGGALVDVPPAHSVMLCFFDDEERGFHGALAFLGKPVGVDRSNIACVLNADMLARADDHILWACGPTYCPPLADALRSVDAPSGITLEIGRESDWEKWSDCRAFQLFRIPWCLFSVENHADYHTPRDTFPRIHASFLVSCATFLRRAVRAVDARSDLLGFINEYNESK